MLFFIVFFIFEHLFGFNDKTINRDFLLQMKLTSTELILISLSQKLIANYDIVSAKEEFTVHYTAFKAISYPWDRKVKR